MRPKRIILLVLLLVAALFMLKESKDILGFYQKESISSSSVRYDELAWEEVPMDHDRLELAIKRHQLKEVVKAPNKTNVHVDPADGIRDTLSDITSDDGYAVPSLVHFTWYGKPHMRFHHMVCFLSVYYRIKPKRILMWYESKPEGEYWDYLKKNITDFSKLVRLVYRKAPTAIFGRPIRVTEHKSDIVRLEAVMNYGGIYLDLDVMVIKSFDPLRRYDVTLGMEHNKGLCNGIIIAKKGAEFLKIWHSEYKTFNDGSWDGHSIRLPFKLSQQYPNLIHVETDTLNRPSWFELDKIYGKKPYDWHRNFAMHLWYRKYNKDHNFQTIKTVDSTMGQMFRWTLYGHPGVM
ncbi:uncharacterized protein LOC135483972 [Lineus longissimus]|uniref:uncharacterized protein LOC135483972 n=1 Tax=Lineus longissimus TaxID=88925 RepID=UPI00315DF53A